MNVNEEQSLYKDALEHGLLNGEACYRQLDHTLSEIERESSLRVRPRRKVLVIVAIAAVLLCAGCAVAYAAGFLIRGKGSRIPFFSNTDSAAVRAEQDQYERHSDSVQEEITVQNGSRILTIENIAVMRDSIAVFYSRNAEENQTKILLSVNGGDDRIPDRVVEAGSNHESVMASFSIFPEVPETCTITIRFKTADGYQITERTYAVDLREGQEGETLILSGKKVQIQGSYSEEPEPPYHPFYDHTVTIESVRINRDGGVVTLSEEILPQGPYTDGSYAAWVEERAAAKEQFFKEHPGSTDLEWTQEGMEAFLNEHPCPMTQEEINALWRTYDEAYPVSWDPFVNFSVTDENGVSLMPQLETYTGGSGLGTARNEILFTPREGMKAIVLTPMYYAGSTEFVRCMMDSSQNTDGKLELVDLKIDKEKRTVTVSYRIPGVRILDSFAEFLLDRNGDPIYPNASYQETRFMDAASGIVTTEIEILDPDWDMDQIGGYAQEWSVPYLDTEHAVTVYLD